MEYAGADAVRRGAPKMKREEGVALRKGRESNKPHSPRAERLKHKQRQSLSKCESEQAALQSAPVVPKQAHTGGDDEWRQVVGTEKKIKGPRVRPKPGAALALAKRETAAILPSQGKKITF